jgi:hypothetical protein
MGIALLFPVKIFEFDFIVMNIKVKDPSTGVLLNLDAKPEKYHDPHGICISHPNGSTFSISNKSGTWEPADNHAIDPILLINIGLVLELYDLEEQI